MKRRAHNPSPSPFLLRSSGDRGPVFFTSTGSKSSGRQVDSRDYLFNGDTPIGFGVLYPWEEVTVVDSEDVTGDCHILLMMATQSSSFLFS